MITTKDVNGDASSVTDARRAAEACLATDTVIPGASMRVLMWMAVIVAILTAAHTSSAGISGPRACCFADGSCQVLEEMDCEDAGGQPPGFDFCSDPVPCVGCCQTDDPPSCEDHVPFVDCIARPNLEHYGSPAVCGSDLQCVTAPTYTATSTATSTVTVTSTPTNTPVPQGGDCTDPAQCVTDFCEDGVCCNTECTEPLMQCNLPGQVGTCATAAAVAPALTPWGLIAGLVLLAGTGAWAMRRRRSSAR